MNFLSFELFFSLLSNTNYSNDLIIQGSREDLENSSITPETTCKKYYNFLKRVKACYGYNIKTNNCICFIKFTKSNRNIILKKYII